MRTSSRLCLKTIKNSMISKQMLATQAFSALCCVSFCILRITCNIYEVLFAYAVAIYMHRQGYR